VDRTLEFWKGIWERTDSFNAKAGWLESGESQQQTPETLWTPIVLDELTTAVKHISNWKSPGLDKLPNFWLKYLSSAHSHLVKCFNDLINGSTSLG